MADSEYPTPDDLHFAGLVQAATAAADESRSSSSLGKRKRANHDDIPIDHSLLNQGLQDHEQAEDIHLQNSAAVLFREPSMKSKKYSRPPLGKVYASLELAPESFLKLQAAGKDFMLDPNHPERRDVVGHRRHSGGTDVAKLKLWNCVEEFLSDAGNGERFFAPGAGQGIPDAPERTMFWPQDAQRIVKQCMPLMRKMVTNERQRLYASETRKSGVNAKLEAQAQPHDQPDQSTSVPQDTLHDDTTTAQPESEPHLTFDQELLSHAEDAPALLPPYPNPTKQVTILVNVMSSAPPQTDPKPIPESQDSALTSPPAQKRLIPRFTLPSSAANNLSSLRSEVQKRLKPVLKDFPTENITTSAIDAAKVKVWMADGLVPIVDDGQWMVALLSAETVEWMDGEVRVLFEVGSRSI